MNRRKLLKGMMTVPVAGALAGCRKTTEPAKSSEGVLRVFLNGPFGVVLRTANDYRITAYVPSDPEHEHELRFRGPSDLAGAESKTEKSPSYRFTLLEDGLSIGHGSPRIDQGFYDFNFPHIGNFELPADFFVAIELPRPDFITFLPPAQPLLFGGKPTLQPLNHILEYRVASPDRVRIKTAEKEQPAVSCSDLLKEYEEYWSSTKYSASNAEGSQRKNMEEMLRNCSASDLWVLFGVGFDPDHPDTDPEKHGINFFNNVLLPSFAPDVRKNLQKEACTAVAENDDSRPALVPADLRYPILRPRLLDVSSVLDCKSGGLLGGSP